MTWRKRGKAIGETIKTGAINIAKKEVSLKGTKVP